MKVHVQATSTKTTLSTNETKWFWNDVTDKMSYWQSSVQADLPAVPESDVTDFNSASCFCNSSTDLECDDLSAATVCLWTSCSDVSWCWCWSTVSDMLRRSSCQMFHCYLYYLCIDLHIYSSHLLTERFSACKWDDGRWMLVSQLSPKLLDLWKVFQ